MSRKLVYYIHHESCSAFIGYEGEIGDGLLYELGDVVNPSQEEFDQLCGEGPVATYTLDLTLPANRMPTTPPRRRAPARPAPPTLEANAVPSESIVKVTHKHAGRVVSAEEEITHPTYIVTHPNPARVKTGGRVTRNLGNMNFITVEASLELPVNPDYASVMAGFDTAAAIVDEHILSRLPEEHVQE